MRDEVKLVTIPKSGTLDTVVDVLIDEFEHGDPTGWTIYHLAPPLTEADYLDLRQNNIKAIIANAREIEDDDDLHEVLANSPGDGIVSLVAEPPGEYPNVLRVEIQSLIHMLSRTETDRGTGCLLRKHRSTTRCHPA